MRKSKLHNDQTGLVAFMVVMIIMILLTLIVLAFGKLVRREQREALDRQLNTQAFYAAESAVNDAADALKRFPALANQDYDQCDQFVAAANAAGASISSVLDGPIVYSCLLVDPSPPELNYDTVPTAESVALPIRSGNGAPITSLEIYFNDSQLENNVSLTACPGLGVFPVLWPATCQIGMLRLELVPFTGAKSRDQLIQDRAIAFVQPASGGASTSFSYASAAGAGGASQGLPIRVTCSAATVPRRCKVTITGLPAGMSSGYLRMRSIYRTTGVTIRAFSGPTQVELSGAQAQIDATGRANDILKRIKVTRPIGNGDDLFPEFALQSTHTQCKRIAIAPPSTLIVGNTGVPVAQQPYCNPAQP